MFSIGKWFSYVAVAGSVILAADYVRADVVQNFDGGGTPYTLGGIATVAGVGNPGDGLRLTPSLGSLFGVAAFELTDPGMYRRILIEFDFRIGEYIQEAADGIGVALLNAGTYGDTGLPAELNSYQEFEEPVYTNSLSVGFDTFDNGGEGDSSVSLNVNGLVLDNISVFPQLENGFYHHASILLEFVPGGVYVTVSILDGGSNILSIPFAGRFIQDLIPYESRLFFGARTGGFSSSHDVDNISAIYSDPVGSDHFYGATSSPTMSELYALNPLTGDATLVGPIGFKRVSGMDFHPTIGVLYATGERIGTTTGVLIRIDPTTGIGTEIGPTGGGFDGSWSDLSFRSDGTLFAFQPLNDPEHTLFTIDTTTGAATVVGDTGLSFDGGNSIAFVGNTLYHVAQDSGLNTLDQVTGQASHVGTVAFYNIGVNGRFSGMDTDSAGVLYGIAKGDGNTFLTTLDLTTRVTRGGRDTGVANMDAIAIQPPQLSVIAPDSVTVTRGVYVTGDETSLSESDNLDFVLRRLGTDIQSRTEFEVMATSPTASPASLEVTLEGSVFARSGVVQTIELWDYPSGAWELVDTRMATNMVDSTATVALTGDLGRFVNPTTFSVEARIHFQSLSPRQRFSSNTDQFIWTIGQ